MEIPIENIHTKEKVNETHEESIVDNERSLFASVLRSGNDCTCTYCHFISI